MKDSRVYLIHIRDCITRIKQYTFDGKEVFYKDIKTQDAVLRNLQIMCESVQKLPPDWKNQYPEIEWNNIAGFRNRLTHEYLNVDLDIIWSVIENYLPGLEITVEAMAQKFWNI
ncbi:MULTISPECIES: HepT-like ribonuclease domain-containing protein [unclassified Nodularia (in: cyanobacteria)]|uniref:HepT-like ribonuclease domain-containing protein n=1 Tax=unclassified Nodularia (in: cyanobacteria) TaxID=2656917 RepID=UPI001880E37D|nr:MULTISPECIES: HepT-like ribonuclease domain-containing protein [unclassified Nodularia (in: cyanobacteria)]MBE9200141.1 DUF86 domain-containing protein [Nodularia sp. LEGE 06071]MCC2694535.1 DUF86 domain-containing protein [Nodularia sp. LEGE 04288]